MSGAIENLPIRDAFISRAYFLPIATADESPHLQILIRGSEGDSFVVSLTELAATDYGPQLFRDYSFEYCVRFGICITDMLEDLKNSCLQGATAGHQLSTMPLRTCPRPWTSLLHVWLQYWHTDAEAFFASREVYTRQLIHAVAAATTTPQFLIWSCLAQWSAAASPSASSLHAAAAVDDILSRFLLEKLFIAFRYWMTADGSIPLLNQWNWKGKWQSLYPLVRIIRKRKMPDHRTGQQISVFKCLLKHNVKCYIPYRILNAVEGVKVKLFNELLRSGNPLLDSDSSSDEFEEQGDIILASAHASEIIQSESKSLSGSARKAARDAALEATGFAKHAKSMAGLETPNRHSSPPATQLSPVVAPTPNMETRFFSQTEVEQMIAAAVKASSPQPAPAPVNSLPGRIECPNCFRMTTAGQFLCSSCELPNTRVATEEDRQQLQTRRRAARNASLINPSPAPVQHSPCGIRQNISAPTPNFNAMYQMQTHQPNRMIAPSIPTLEAVKCPHCGTPPRSLSDEICHGCYAPIAPAGVRCQYCQFVIMDKILPNGHRIPAADVAQCPNCTMVPRRSQVIGDVAKMKSVEFLNSLPEAGVLPASVRLKVHSVFQISPAQDRRFQAIRAGATLPPHFAQCITSAAYMTALLECCQGTPGCYLLGDHPLPVVPDARILACFARGFEWGSFTLITTLQKDSKCTTTYPQEFRAQSDDDLTHDSLSFTKAALEGNIHPYDYSDRNAITILSTDYGLTALCTRIFLSDQLEAEFTAVYSGILQRHHLESRPRVIYTPKACDAMVQGIVRHWIAATDSFLSASPSFQQQYGTDARYICIGTPAMRLRLWFEEQNPETKVITVSSWFTKTYLDPDQRKIAKKQLKIESANEMLLQRIGSLESALKALSGNTNLPAAPANDSQNTGNDTGRSTTMTWSKILKSAMPAIAAGKPFLWPSADDPDNLVEIPATTKICIKCLSNSPGYHNISTCCNPQSSHAFVFENNKQIGFDLRVFEKWISELRSPTCSWTSDEQAADRYHQLALSVKRKSSGADVSHAELAWHVWETGEDLDTDCLQLPTMEQLRATFTFGKKFEITDPPSAEVTLSYETAAGPADFTFPVCDAGELAEGLWGVECHRCNFAAISWAADKCKHLFLQQTETDALRVLQEGSRDCMQHLTVGGILLGTAVTEAIEDVSCRNQPCTFDFVAICWPITTLGEHALLIFRLHTFDTGVQSVEASCYFLSTRPIDLSLPVIIGVMYKAHMYGARKLAETLSLQDLVSKDNKLHQGIDIQFIPCATVDDTLAGKAPTVAHCIPWLQHLFSPSCGKYAPGDRPLIDAKSGMRSPSGRRMCWNDFSVIDDPLSADDVDYMRRIFKRFGYALPAHLNRPPRNRQTTLPYSLEFSADINAVRCRSMLKLPSEERDHELHGAFSSSDVDEASIDLASNSDNDLNVDQPAITSFFQNSPVRHQCSSSLSPLTEACTLLNVKLCACSVSCDHPAALGQPYCPCAACYNGRPQISPLCHVTASCIPLATMNEIWPLILPYILSPIDLTGVSPHQLSKLPTDLVISCGRCFAHLGAMPSSDIDYLAAFLDNDNEAYASGNDILIGDLIDNMQEYIAGAWRLHDMKGNHRQQSILSLTNSSVRMHVFDWVASDLQQETRDDTYHASDWWLTDLPGTIFTAVALASVDTTISKILKLMHVLTRQLPIERILYTAAQLKVTPPPLQTAGACFSIHTWAATNTLGHSVIQTLPMDKLLRMSQGALIDLQRVKQLQSITIAVGEALIATALAQLTATWTTYVQAIKLPNVPTSHSGTCCFPACQNTLCFSRPICFTCQLHSALDLAHLCLFSKPVAIQMYDQRPLYQTALRVMNLDPNRILHEVIDRQDFSSFNVSSVPFTLDNRKLIVCDLGRVELPGPVCITNSEFVQTNVETNPDFHQDLDMSQN